MAWAERPQRRVSLTLNPKPADETPQRRRPVNVFTRHELAAIQPCQIQVQQHAHLSQCLLHLRFLAFGTQRMRWRRCSPRQLQLLFKSSRASRHIGYHGAELQQRGVLEIPGNEAARFRPSRCFHATGERRRMPSARERSKTCDMIAAKTMVPRSCRKVQYICSHSFLLKSITSNTKAFSSVMGARQLQLESSRISSYRTSNKRKLALPQCLHIPLWSALSLKSRIRCCRRSKH